ncbi:LamB/YcsF family protein [Sporosarcina sp. BI001-red]|uniref:LamB/YcsF family protein n=1 Tax=Sporosarcina sp. BI001-red TaxID=2282866 RepID=UPI000E280670|nr:5-oxoprolinase subunit PxpA [Sporosarcina sp. BI001-red]REB08046.1 LamB/YcsF family protein [Sporosarcina sp. BI001-red]
MTVHIDINCDLGESFGAYKLGNDEEVMKHITSANIACGFHAGDPKTMHTTIDLACRHDVAIGAHPGLQDLNGFGRREMKLTQREIYDLMVYQIGALQGFVKAAGATLHHVKPHGALYNMAAKDKRIAEAIALAVLAVAPEAILYGLSGSELVLAGKAQGLLTANEVFADRTYQPDLSLTPRAHPDAIIEDYDVVMMQVLGMVNDGVVPTGIQQETSIQADTICIHGDHEGARSLAKRMRTDLTLNGISVTKAGDFIHWTP